jgi:hypothetical protein
MKFSHSIQFNAVPDWSDYYIAYDNLKKLFVTTPPSLILKWMAAYGGNIGYIAWSDRPIVQTAMALPTPSLALF